VSLERLHLDGDVVVLDLVVDGVRRLCTLVSCRHLDGCLEDEDVVLWCLSRMGASKIGDLLAAALKMAKGKKTCSWPLHTVARCRGVSGGPVLYPLLPSAPQFEGP
jgi:hypothetical protein